MYIWFYKSLQEIVSGLNISHGQTLPVNSHLLLRVLMIQEYLPNISDWCGSLVIWANQVDLSELRKTLILDKLFK